MFGNSGVIFGMDGPNMEGTWYNPQTGDSFTVRNSFFEDNQYIVQTTDGRVLGYNQIQNYVKSDGPIDLPKKQDSLPEEVANLIDESYDAEIAELLAPKPLGNLAQPVQPTSLETTISPTNLNSLVVEKALSKCSVPKLQVGIEWDNFPKTEAKWLVDLMDVSVDDVVNYYLNQVDISTTTTLIHEVLRDHISKQLGITPDEIVPGENTAVEKPTKKVSKPKTTRKNKNKGNE
jgi:hypothetical protein